MKRAIEEDFPIVEINRLVVPERNGFKPVYQMHKSFAPRASCVFRAILLAALKPAGTNIISEFYKDHTNDPDTKGKIVIDPFMGGGTTVVEATRLGVAAVGIELNPVPWFVVKMALAPASIKDLDNAYARLEERIVPWSGKTVAETLSGLYETQRPFISSGGKAATASPTHTVHTYWVKSAVCTIPTCKKHVPLYTDYVVARKAPSIRYHADCTCPNCERKFDWDVEPAALVADPRLMFHASTYSAGVGRTTTRWTYAHPSGGLFVSQGETLGGQGQCRWGTVGKGQVCCPHCYETVTPRLAKPKTQRKKVPIAALHCPRTEEVFQWRGELAAETQVASPSGHAFFPLKGHVPAEGGFICPHCGNPDSVISSIRTLPSGQRLEMHVHAVQSYCPDADLREADEEDSAPDLFAEEGNAQAEIKLSPGSNLIWKNKGKFFAPFTSKDVARYQETAKCWADHKAKLPWPRSEIPKGQETGRLHEDHVSHFWQMFNERQLLALSTLLQAIMDEPDTVVRDLLLLAFSGSVERNNLFCRYFNDRNTIQGNFDRHDYARKIDPAENAVWGFPEMRGTFQNMLGRVREGLTFRTSVYDRDLDRLGEPDSLIFSRETIALGAAQILNGDSREVIPSVAQQADAVVTDPPYAGNVNYSELYDFFYVWLRLALKDRYDAFKPEYTPKIPEIVENKTRGLSNADFRDGLRTVFERCREKLKDEGVMAFTYHHSGNQQWVDLCDAVCLAGFVIEAVYPVHAEKESSLNLQNNEGISYDLIHVCRKRSATKQQARRSWAGLRQLVRQRAKDEIALIESGRYGSRPLSPADVRIVLIGKCLEIYSRHYGTVLDWAGNPMPMREALIDIGEMVEQMISKGSSLPAELENTDVLSRIWLRALADMREITVDSIRKHTQGFVELSDLTGHKPPLVYKKRAKGGRTYEVLTPMERFDGLREMLKGAGAMTEQLTLLDSTDNTPVVFGPKLVDVVHLLAANAEQGERLDHLVERFRGQREQIRAALQYLRQNAPNRWGKTCDKLLPFYDDLFAQAAVAKEAT